MKAKAKKSTTTTNVSCNKEFPPVTPIVLDLNIVKRTVTIFTRNGRKRENYIEDIIKNLGGTAILSKGSREKHIELILEGGTKITREDVIDYCQKNNLRFGGYGYIYPY